jgi:3-oxoacyl-[acyl-carrier-protein] synthase II
VRPLDFEWVAAFDLAPRFAGIAAAEPAQFLTKPELNNLDRASQFALLAAREAFVMAGLAADSVAPERLAVVISSALGGITTTLGAWDTMQDRGARRLLPGTIPMLMPNAAAAAVSKDLHARAGAHAPSAACAAGAEAIAVGFDLIRSGRADVVVAGGTEAPIHPLVVGAFAAARALSVWPNATGSRPFALGRDGFVLAEGAGVVVLESAAHAHARGGRVLARLAGVGVTADAYHMTAPDPDGRGQIAAMRVALEQAGAQPGDVVHVNPHATSTPVGDAVEAASIASVLGNSTCQALVSATKSLTGHLLGGAGGLEAVLTVLAVAHRTAPPTIHLTHLAEQDPDIALRIQKETPGVLPEGDILALTNSFGFGGHNVALAIASA